ncbi:MAG: hypothetical protein IJP55_02795 [Bacteroidales bacterium]|nr:hypothetical protein [Bacteroidales bacterium]
MTIPASILTAASLCADCFAVSLCSSVTLKELRRTTVLKVALSFAEIQAGLLWAGWALGSLVASLVITALSAVLGICGGRAIGKKTGRTALIIGGCVLIGIGISLLFRPIS